MKIYESPELIINRFETADVITISSVGLNYGGENGASEKASFNDLFGK